MNFGLTESQIQILNQIVIRPLTEKGVNIYVFGSRARGIHHPFSDLDLLLENSEHLPLIELALIREKLENSKLTFKVDLVLKHELAQSYQTEVEKDKLIWNL